MILVNFSACGFVDYDCQTWESLGLKYAEYFLFSCNEQLKKLCHLVLPSFCVPIFFLPFGVFGICNEFEMQLGIK